MTRQHGNRKILVVLLFVPNLPTATIVATSAGLPPAVVFCAVVLVAVSVAVPTVVPHVVVYGRWW